MGWTNGNAENDELSLRKRAIIRLSTNTPSPASWEITQAPLLNERKPFKCFPAILPTGDIHAKVLPCHREFGIGRSKRRGCGAKWQLVLLWPCDTILTSTKPTHTLITYIRCQRKFFHRLGSATSTGKLKVDGQALWSQQLQQTMSI
jgi:hypothetical protein